MATKAVAIKMMCRQFDRQAVFWAAMMILHSVFLKVLTCGFRVFSLRDEFLDSALLLVLL
jgi:hypothetical protein